MNMLLCTAALGVFAGCNSDRDANPNATEATVPGSIETPTSTAVSTTVAVETVPPSAATTTVAAAETSTTVATTSTAAGENPCAYTVQPGDSLSGIGDTYSQKQVPLMEENPSVFPDRNPNSLPAFTTLDVCPGNGIDDITGQPRAAATTTTTAPVPPTT